MTSPALPSRDDAWPLERVQRWMLAVISHAGGTAEGLASDAAQQAIPIPATDLARVVTSSPRQDPAARLEIYAQAYFARLLECLRHEFSLTRLAMGDELFDAFAIGCLQAFPPSSYTLAKLGENFPRYLRQSRPQDIPPPAWPDFLIELAALERAQSEVFDGPGVERTPPRSEPELSELSPEAWAESRLELNPSLRLLCHSFPIAAWCASAREAQAPSEMPEARPSWLALVRRDYVVQRWELDEPQYALLHALVEGRTVGQALECAAAVAGDVESLSADVQRWFFELGSVGFSPRRNDC